MEVAQLVGRREQRLVLAGLQPHPRPRNSVPRRRIDDFSLNRLGPAGLRQQNDRDKETANFSHPSLNITPELIWAQ
jgi:hypothetical protein